MRAIVDAVIRSSFAQPLCKWYNRGKLTVIAYHAVLDTPRFEAQMSYVNTHLCPVGLEDILDSIRLGTTLPDKAVLVTFDDGYRSVLETALPILLRHSMPAVVYVVAGLLDTDDPFWWDEVMALVRQGGQAEGVSPTLSPEDVVRALKRVPNAQRLATIEQLRDTARQPAPRRLQLRRSELPVLEAGGIAVGNHTLTHPCLHQCEDATIRHELHASQDILTEALGHPPRTLAYPNGDHDPRVRQAASDLGFETGFLFDHRLSALPPADPLRISRLRVDSDTPMDRFKIILSGLHPALHHAIGRS